jgi:hypothetical protein
MPPDRKLLALSIVAESGAVDDRTLWAMRSTSRALRPLAIEQEVGSAFFRDAIHAQPRRVREMGAAAAPGAEVVRWVPEETTVPAARMLEIAVMAYNTAVQLKRRGEPVILYRVAGKRTLSDTEQLQTLSSSVKARLALPGGGSMEVWPILKTAAWIQGAMRARVPFILLNDPREDLVGGPDKASDAVYVRELHQILSMRYTIGMAPPGSTPTAQRAKGIAPFILEPPKGDLGPIPVVPRISQVIDWNSTWDSRKTSLTIGSPPGLLRDYLTRVFTEAGTHLKIPAYPADSWRVD